MINRPYPASTRLARKFAQLAVAVALSASAMTLANCGGDSHGVTNPPAPVLSRIDVSASTATLSPAQTITLTAVARTADGTVISAPSLAWSSSSNAVATVNAGGVVTAVAPGTVSISATSGAVNGSVALRVIPAGGTIVTVDVRLSDGTLTLGSMGQAIASALDANNAVVAIGSRPIVWTSTNPNIATISANGVIAAIGIGSVTIRGSVTEGSSTLLGTSILTVARNPDAKPNVDVTMPGETFSPSDVVVKLNGTVRFIFPPQDHNVFWRATRPGAPADINTIQKATVTRTFNTVGVFPFVCTLHNGMTGTVIVSP